MKWTLKAFREYLKNIKMTLPDDPNVKKLDIDQLFNRIHDIVVKTIISAEPLLWNGVEMYVPNQYQYGHTGQSDTNKKNNNCFELLGFDILIDNDFRPWLLEVNLSPSLSTDTQLDFKIKGGLLSDLFNLVGLLNDDMQTKKIQQIASDAQPNGNAAQEKGNKIIDQALTSTNSQVKNGNIMKKTFLPKVFKQ